MECKLRDISQEPKVFREEQLQKCVFGKNAFILDDSFNGTTIFVPWRLHKPIEELFQSYADSGVMHTDQFISLVDKASLFPTFQNKRKKEDIVNVILERTNKNDQGLLFEDFLFALHLLARYRASVLRLTVQSSFNHMLSSLINLNKEKETSEPSDTSTAGKVDSLPQSRNSSIDSTVRTENESQSQEEPAETQDAESVTDTITAKDPIEILRSKSKDHSSSAYKSLEIHLSELIKALNDSGVHAENRNLQERLNEEMELRRNAELDSMNRQRKLEEESLEVKKDLLSKESSIYSLERTVDNLKEELERLTAMKEESENKLNIIISDLEKKVGDLDNELERRKLEVKLKQEMQEKLILDSEDEVKLFSIFCVYRDELPVNGEFVVSENSCIAFCLDFGLGDSDSPRESHAEPKAKQAYDKVSGQSVNGHLTYILFKEFLMQLSLLFKPELTPREGFKFIV
ncbi:conserved hypothetical protein [Theileria equi strain WA]|uniref:Uncharacterized protein n=1 Tax=Theileria equi strain WA TaxID=1537102 RepID=L1LFY1_THEEQ|nr:conserved hypothetical protein [Theileria equi strain WA]EKX74179.1 conserved hypothetical protein [Theileria equi strain WA]|eukprot:XP_004833631.1 conserved hypothetical protein [Theileria equi strain WA]